MKLKIAVFNDWQKPFPPVLGGSVPTLLDIILKENEKYQKYDIDVYSCYNKKAKEQSKNYKSAKFIYSRFARLIRLYTNVCCKLKIPVNLSRLPLPPKIKKYFISQKYDVVYISGYIRGCLPIMELSNCPSIIHHHVVTDILHEPSIDGEDIINKATLCCFVSDFATNYARTGSEEQNSKMITFPNSIDVDSFQLLDKQKSKLKIRKKYGINNNDIVIMFAGRLTKVKGALELIQAFINCNFGDNVKLLIIGGATYASNKITKYVEQCQSLCQQNKNIIMTGYVDYSEMPEYYMASDIGTLISRYDEACGLVGIECMSAGIPVITTDNAGIPQYVADGCKIVVNDNENIVHEIEDALKTLVNNPTLRKEMGDKGIEVSKNFNASNYFKRFEQIIDSIVK